jgi:hypothetical protein
MTESEQQHRQDRHCDHAADERGAEIADVLRECRAGRRL